MDRITAMEKVKSLLPDLDAWLIKRCDELLRSGGVDTESFEDDYLLPKIVLTAALKEGAETLYMPRARGWRRLVKNLGNF